MGLAVWYNLINIRRHKPQEVYYGKKNQLLCHRRAIQLRQLRRLRNAPGREAESNTKNAQNIGTTGKAGTRLLSTTLPTSTRRQESRSKAPFLLQFFRMENGVPPHSNQYLPQPGQKWPGFSFALYLLRVQGFCFALLQYSPIQSFTACFVPSMQLYRPRRKTSHRALQGRFL